MYKYMYIYIYIYTHIILMFTLGHDDPEAALSFLGSPLEAWATSPLPGWEKRMVMGDHGRYMVSSHEYMGIYINGCGSIPIYTYINNMNTRMNIDKSQRFVDVNRRALEWF